MVKNKETPSSSKPSKDQKAVEKATRPSDRESRANNKVRSKFTMELGITSRDSLKKGKLSDAKYKPEKEFKKLTENKNALAKHFDVHNGDYDTPEELVRAFFKGDEMALKNLNIKHISHLKDVLDELYPEMKDENLDDINNPAKLTAYLNDLKKRLNPKPSNG